MLFELKRRWDVNMRGYQELMRSSPENEETHTVGPSSIWPPPHRICGLIALRVAVIVAAGDGLVSGRASHVCRRGPDRGATRGVTGVVLGRLI